ncbi:MAG: TRAP transporter substrate-binding protein DctP [Rhizobiaceae bacterium]
MKSVVISALCAGLIANFGNVAAAETLRAASAFGLQHINARVTYPEMIKRLEMYTDGRLTIKDFPSGLVGPKDMVNAIQSGTVDMGTIIMLYFAADYKDSLLPGELSPLSSNPIALSSAATEYIVNCKDCQAEFRKVEQVYLGSGSTAPSEIMSTVPIRQVSDMEGLRIRTGGALLTMFIEYMGAETIQIPSSEAFEALSQGIVKAHFGSIPNLLTFRLIDVVKYVTLIDFAPFISDSSFSTNAKTWASLSAADRVSLAKATNDGYAAALLSWQETAAQATEEAQAKGIEFITPAPDFGQKTSEFVDTHLKGLVAALQEKGVGDPEGKIETFKALVKKWDGLVAGLDEVTVESVAKLRWEEIWSKIDFETYGK